VVFLYMTLWWAIGMISVAFIVTERFQEREEFNIREVGIGALVAFLGPFLVLAILIYEFNMAWDKYVKNNDKIIKLFDKKILTIGKKK